MPYRDREPGGVECYAPLLAALRECGATLEAACLASDHLARRTELHASPASHAAALRGALLLARDAALARRDSRDCPECQGTGYARRRYVEPALLRWRTMVPLYCRCPLGRVLLARDAGRADPPVKCDDLQARPDLWDGRLDHWTWSPEPVESARVYVRPGSPEAWYEAPEGAAQKTGLRGHTAMSPGGRASKVHPPR